MEICQSIKWFLQQICGWYWANLSWSKGDNWLIHRKCWAKNIGRIRSNIYRYRCRSKWLLLLVVYEIGFHFNGWRELLRYGRIKLGFKKYLCFWHLVHLFVLTEIVFVPNRKLLIDNKGGSTLIYMATRSTHVNFFGHKSFFKNLSYVFI